MIFRKFFIFAVLACTILFVEARYISWSGTALCVYDEHGDREPIGTFHDAAAKPQGEVFVWLEKEWGIFVDRDPWAMNIWIEGSYKLADGYGWRLEWPNLFLAKSALPYFCTSSGQVLYYSDEYSYSLFKVIDAENLTAGQLREKLNFLPAGVISQIVREFTNQMSEFANQNR